ncbi:MAG: YraN family protein [Candidatus Omnitrophota bacterium]|nr:YraN family protein [Candidatus Omnitrophota bacterium]
MRNKEVGDLGERLAAKFLRRGGYTILARKYRCKFGEIDIVAKDRNTLVFVEVRSRSDSGCGLPYETIDYKKREHIKRVAAEFLKRFNLFDYDCRFDCVSVLFDDNFKPKQIELIKDAFWS